MIFYQTHNRLPGSKMIKIAKILEISVDLCAIVLKNENGYEKPGYLFGFLVAKNRLQRYIAFLNLKKK